jgi:hypothetical protein
MIAAAQRMNVRRGHGAYLYVLARTIVILVYRLQPSSIVVGVANNVDVQLVGIPACRIAECVGEGLGARTMNGSGFASSANMYISNRDTLCRAETSSAHLGFVAAALAGEGAAAVLKPAMLNTRKKATKRGKYISTNGWQLRPSQ